MLHTLIQSPFKTNVSLLLDMLESQDDFLALQDGVLIALTDNIFLKRIISSDCALYVIKEDVYARGLYNHISSHFRLIDYIYFVSLTVKNKQQMTW
ncbi:sulfurtransferase complex subunit TusB [Buchnera aphidicola]|uniref:sulfurtransferase complex subunit TusB n=1 Tax=Buchnera aphidicola TaxID=9 RepID=UPI0034643214